MKKTISGSPNCLGQFLAAMHADHIRCWTAYPWPTVCMPLSAEHHKTCKRCADEYQHRTHGDLSWVLEYPQFMCGTLSVLVKRWCGLASALVVITNRSLLAVRYWDEVILPVVVPKAGAVGSIFDLNARLHCTHLINMLQWAGIKRVDRTSLAPDLNPIENVWDALDIMSGNPSNASHNTSWAGCCPGTTAAGGSYKICWTIWSYPCHFAFSVFLLFISLLLHSLFFSWIDVVRLPEY